MPVPTDITAGTITITNGSKAVTGVGTGWLASDIRRGDLFIWIEGGDGFWQPIVASVESNTALTLEEDWEGPTLTGAPYRLRYQWDSSRVSAQARQLIDQLGNGNIQALSGLTGPGVPVFDGPHSMAVKPEADFINGVAYDVQVDTLADRDAYDGQPEGFAVLVSDVGDGRSAIYSKVSASSGDWSDPAYVTGPAGPLPDVDATVANSAPGTSPSVTPVPVAGGVRLDFVLPEASGFYNAGEYDLGEPYDQDDVVQHNGSSFIALQPVPAGESPSSAFPPVDTAYWQVLAAKGADGSGTGDVVGPSGVADGNIAVFDGTTGKLIRDGGASISELVPADGSITNAKLADMETARIKGRVAAGDGPPGDLTAAEAWSVLGEAPVVNAYARSNILGAVSQSGGVPTGAIIESGTNANGEYVKFADGTMIAWATVSVPGPTGPSGSIFMGASAPVTFPAAFVGSVSTSASIYTLGVWAGIFEPSPTGCAVRAFCGVSVAGTQDGRWIAIGRWYN